MQRLRRRLRLPPPLRAFVKRTVHSMVHSLVQLLRWLWGIVQSWIRRWSGPVVHLDTGIRVRVGRQIAEGGYSYVFEAFDVASNEHYALKRIRCPEPEILSACRHEAGVHRSVNHPNLMPLLGMTVQHNSADCFMLFPYMEHSLRAEVNRRTWDRDNIKHAPWNELTALHIFYKICRSVQALHQANMSHRDIKLENVLFQDVHSRQPVLMDFGSVGPLAEGIPTRQDVLRVTEQASMHTTVSYRAPELFEGGLRAGDADLDYDRVDVWSLGCTLFGMLYGASPTECNFRADGRLQIVECTQLKVLAGMPTPVSGSPPANWYSADIQALTAEMLTQDRHQRPTLTVVMEKIEVLIRQQGGKVDRNEQQRHTQYHDNDDDEDNAGIALMISSQNQNFV